MSIELVDSNSSPECVLTTLPVKDPYSTDEEGNRTIKELGENNGATKSPNYTTTLYNGTEFTIHTLMKYFKIEFHPCKQGPTCEQLCHMEMNHLMEQLMYFLTNKKEVYSRKVLEDLLQIPERGSSVLYFNKDFHINFKDPGSILLPEIVSTSSGCYRQACNFIQKLSRLLWVTRETSTVDSKYQYDTVKACMAEFCRLTYEYLWEGGECINVIQSMKRSEKTGSENTMHFKSHPNLVLNLACKDTPGIPFEVYSPTKEQRTTIRKSHGKQSNNRYEETDSIAMDTNERKFMEQFLSNNIPVFMSENQCTGSKTLNKCDTALKSQLVTEHILQIIGVASNYCFKKYTRALKQMEKSKVFIGLLICNEYVYISKVQGDESTFAKYHKGFQSYIVGKDQMQLWLRRGIQSADDPVIHVQFSSIVLDLSIHNHRMALLLCMQYYMNNWDKVML